MNDSQTQPAWHCLPGEQVLQRLEASSHGLSAHEAQRRLARYGANTIRTGEKVRPWAIFLHQFTSPLIYVLLAAMGVTLLIQHWADAIVIALVLAMNATIGFFQEYRAEHAMQALLGMIAPRATVRRDGQRCEVDSEQLVPGDVVLLESGGLVPADIRVLEESELRVDESILTGESVTTGKTLAAMPQGSAVSVADRRNMLFMGTTVAAGRAKGVVVATGPITQIGQIAGQMRTTERTRTPLQQRMNRFGNRVSLAIVVVSVLAFGIGIVQGVPAAEMFLMAVAVAVAAIPEGLPVVMTVALAVSVRRMARRHAIIRRLPAVETLGSCTVIMSDKTGTLTENRMTVERLWAGGAEYTVTGGGLEIDGRVLHNQAPVVLAEGSSLYLTLLTGLLANEADLRRTMHDGIQKIAASGDPTEVALLVAAAKAGLRREDLLDRHPQVGHVPFEPERKFSATVHRSSDEQVMTFVKGAPERIVEMCEWFMTEQGPLAMDQAAALAEAHRMAGQGLRVLGMAIGSGQAASEAIRHDQPRGLMLVGLVGMMDPPRAEAVQAVASCHQAGIRVIMVTGDHARTAAAIAEKLNLVPEHARGSSDEPYAVVTGVELERLGDAEVRDKLRHISVYARVSPVQKLRIVKLLRELGHIVAVTGDGVNDAPALKAAHIGAAMGISGTDVAKEASEMVLSDDNFATIYAAVEEGRTAFSNIRKATDFLLSSAVGVVTAVFGLFVMFAFGMFERYGMTSMPLLLLPAQILWLNVVTNGIQDVAMAFEPGEKEQYRRPPRHPEEGLMSPLLAERTVLVGLLLAAVAIYVFLWELGRGSSLAYAQTATLTAMVAFKALHVGACRSETLSIFQKSMISNPVLFIGTGASLAVHIGAMYLGPAQKVLSIQPLSVPTWGVILMAAPSVLGLVELHKLLRRQPQAGRLL